MENFFKSTPLTQRFHKKEILACWEKNRHHWWPWWKATLSCKIQKKIESRNDISDWFLKSRRVRHSGTTKTIWPNSKMRLRKPHFFFQSIECGSVKSEDFKKWGISPKIQSFLQFWSMNAMEDLNTYLLEYTSQSLRNAKKVQLRYVIL